MDPKAVNPTNKIEMVDYERRHDLTIEEVRNFEKYCDYSDDEIKTLIETFKAFSRIVFNLYSKEPKVGRKIALHIDNQQTKAA